MEMVSVAPDCADALARAEANSPFLRGLIEAQPGLAQHLHGGDIAAAEAWVAAAGRAAPDVGAALRRERKGLALLTAIADLSGAWDLAAVTARLSDFADDACARAIAAAMAERTPDASPAGFTVIALGKHGGRELNYSSDIDPIFIFDPDTLPRRGREEPVEAAVRLSQRIIDLLGRRDAEGYVFRVDMRLRPSPEVSPVALPVDAAISYYESSALAWEQAAFIRARIAAGDAGLGRRFMDAVRPFVWRRSLDYGQLRNIGDVSAQIRAYYAAGQRFGPGYDLKRGRGGIREAEFFAQVHQLIHGGRNPALRTADTRGALAALAAAGHVDADEAARLADGYAALRTAEHRVQMLHDRQTHDLPADPAQLGAAARLHGAPDGAAWLATLAPHVEAVGRAFDRIVPEGDAAPLPQHGEGLDEALAAAGHDPDDARRINRWRSGTVRAIRSAPARASFERVLPAIVTALGAAPDPARAMARFDNLVEGLPSAINIFHLLEARPALLKLIGDVLSYAPTLADALARRGELMDGLVDAAALHLPGEVPAIIAAIGPVREHEAYEDFLDRVRTRIGELRFALGVQLINGRTDPIAVAAAYARVAEAAIGLLLPAAVSEMEAVHGRVAQGSAGYSELVVLALGRLGGGALTHASDLDLIFLFTGHTGGESDGPRLLDTTRYFQRLAQRSIAALSVPTAAGALYEVDTRLRPSGAGGLIAVSVDSFARYQREDAWTWEHMALTRARPLFGSAAARAAVQAVVGTVLCLPRDPDGLRCDVAAMRADIARYKPALGPLDVKLLPGGLVDLEFLVHYQQLRHGAGLVPELPGAIAALAAAGHLPADLVDTHRLLTGLLVLVRLVAPNGKEPPAPARALIARALGLADWDAVIAEVETARAIIIEHYRAAFGGHWQEQI